MSKPISATWSNNHRPADVAAYVESGAWPNLTLADYLDAAMRADPDRTLFWETTRRWTVRDIHDSAHALASALNHLGVRRGDVISFQLPNWCEAVIIDCAAAIGGFVNNPIVLIYRDAELRQILPDCQSKVIFIPESYRGFDFRAMAERVRADAPSLQHLVTVRGDGALTLESLIALGKERPLKQERTDPNRPKLIMYTSGTTGRAKGVVHCHNAIHCDLSAHQRFWKLTEHDRSFVTGPVGHMSGYLYACNGPLQWRIDCAVVERWNVDEAADLIDNLGLTFTVGATPFLQDLVALSRQTGRKFETLRLFACGGAPVPPEIIRSVYRTLPNTVSYRCYGSTEAPTTTLGVSDPSDIDACALTDGEIFNNYVKVVDDDGRTLAAGCEGEILIRGPECMMGYSRDEDNAAAFDEDGYWRSGDLGVLDARQRVTVTGRKKDLIIRGGENLSAKEIEDAMHTHPAIRQASVVAAPHPRMGESVYAFIVCQEGATIDLPELSAFLTKAGLAKQKIPEAYELVTDLPMTPFGKVKKNVLRDRLAEKIRS
ncbi:MAG: AMP-binding protein [Rhizobiales bacterium]|nr:AMP-binding protein [Hyphomicrobiales bacterium]